MRHYYILKSQTGITQQMIFKREKSLRLILQNIIIEFVLE